MRHRLALKLLCGAAASAICFSNALARTEAEPAPAMRLVEDTQATIQEEILEGELEVLAQLIQAEAGNQSYQGKRLVASVVLNRVADPDFPDTISGVIFQSGQFSCINDGNFARAGWTVTQEDYRAAHEEYAGRTDSRVLYFTSGGWGRFGTPLFKCGDHYFCGK